MRDRNLKVEELAPVIIGYFSIARNLLYLDDASSLRKMTDVYHLGAYDDTPIDLKERSAVSQ